MNYRILKIASFSLLLFGISSCEEQLVNVDRFGTITGIVVNGSTYEPLPGVLITTSPASSAVLTDEGGSFQLEKIVAGDVLINARRNEYLTGSINVAVFEEENTSVTFFLLEDENNVGNVVLFDPVPGNGAVDQPLTQTLSWNVDQEDRSVELEYTVYLFESNSTTQTIVSENLANREAVVSNLRPNTTYFWYVVAKFDGKNVANSPTWTFRTGA
ncbi:MAG: carboxypeptidase-like regulatory domain-containing protein [Bacteroidota bacterium]|uniref:CarboxypepD_reg-like domain-containing protein n=1 Tax=Algoriphagus faecimaris TaxID=686796 RepID=A0A1G6UKJ1_9BACT|nr:carboxypeptidase-like regulatory domain-containing protein [Algoriphagus faecimaris]SDD41872.1 CarboxypepD_reg-like domain-containing protein [Algoriphagus faecimaris]